MEFVRGKSAKSHILKDSGRKGNGVRSPSSLPIAKTSSHEVTDGPKHDSEEMLKKVLVVMIRSLCKCRLRCLDNLVFDTDTIYHCACRIF